MSIRIMSQVWEEALNVKGGDLLVLLALADFADDEGRCWPSVPTIARKSRLTVRQVYRSIKNLIDSKHIHRNSVTGKRTSYTVLPIPVAAVPTPVTPDRMSPPTPDNLSPVTPDRMSGVPLTFDTQTPDICATPTKEEPPTEPSWGERGRARPKQAHPIPDDWRPSEDHAKLAADLGVSITWQADQFRDHATANGKTRVNWDADFSSWLRKSHEFRTSHSNGNHRPRKFTPENEWKARA